MSTVESFIHSQTDEQREILLFLHHYLVNDFNLNPKISYKIPFYYRKTWVCYLNPTKTNTVELAFPRGHELSNAQGLLESKERKQVRSMELKSLEDFPKVFVEGILHEAVLLDETVPYRLKK